MATKLPYYLLLLYWLALIGFALGFDGLGGDGDTVNHFLFAKYAFQHPENFFNHWAKPLYVMLMAPIAQLGFTAVKIVNATLLVASMFFGLRLGEKIGLQSSLLAVLAFFSIPMCYYWSLSGLTEPLFAYWLMFGIYLLFIDKIAWGTLFLSFLPFVRSEGLIILCVIFVFLLVKKNWKSIPLLVVGHLIFAVMGYPIHGRLDWVFSKIPYANLDSSSGYGTGKWYHYAKHMPDVIGPFLTAFLVLGLIAGLLRFIRYFRQKSAFPKQELLLVYGIFLAFFVAHSIFWAFGMFNSYGLMRVFLGLAPLIALISARGIELVFTFLQIEKARKAFYFILIPLLVYNIFHKQKWASMQLTSFQKAFKPFAEAHKQAFAADDFSLYRDFVDADYFLGIDPFDKSRIQFSDATVGVTHFPKNTWVIWDRRFSIVDHQFPVEKLQENPLLVPFDTLIVDSKPAFFIFKNVE